MSEPPEVEYQVWYSPSGARRISGRKTFRTLSQAEEFVKELDYYRIDKISRKVVRLKGHEYTEE